MFKILVFAVFLGQFLILSASVCEAETARRIDASSPDQLQNPFGKDVGIGEKGIVVLVAKVIRQVMGVIGSITLLAFMYGGFLWLTSAGKQDQVSKGTKTMLYAFIGIIVIFSSYVVLSAIITGLTKP